MLRPRNTVVRDGGLQRRGGAHTTTKSGQRQLQKSQLADFVDEYFDESGDSPGEDPVESKPGRADIWHNNDSAAATCPEHNMDIPELLTTRRLELMRPAVADAQAVFEAYSSDPDVTRYLSFEPHKNVDQTKTWLDTVTNGWENETRYAWAIFLKTENRLIGMIDLSIDGFRAETGYALGKSYWRQGYMPEVLIAMRDMVFSVTQVERFQLVCDLDNPASARVMEKAGFEKEGILRRYNHHPNVSDRPRDCFCYSYIRP